MDNKHLNIIHMIETTWFRSKKMGKERSSITSSIDNMFHQMQVVSLITANTRALISSAKIEIIR